LLDKLPGGKIGLKGLLGKLAGGKFVLHIVDSYFNALHSYFNALHI